MVLIKSIFDQLKLRVNAQSDVGVAFLNFLNSFCDFNEYWRPTIVTDFFLECLVYPHWQQNRDRLRNDLQRYLVDIQQKAKLDLKLEDVQWVTELQVITVDNLKDQQELLQEHITQRLYKEKKPKFRFIQDKEHVLVILLDEATKQLEIRLFDHRFTVRNGHLVPLRDQYRLLFDQSLNLLEGIPFSIELGPFIRAKFIVQQGLYEFYATRGYLFQRFQVASRLPCENIPRLFYPLKRLESYFLKKETNPLYIGLTQELERANHQLRLKEPLSAREVMDILVRGRNALEFVFTEDKLLGLMIKELESKSSVNGAESYWSLPHYDFIGNSTESLSTQKGSPTWLPDHPQELFDLTDL